MFFVLSKLLDVLVDPLWWGLSAVGLALALFARGVRPRLARASALTGVAVWLVFSLPAVSNRLFAALEAGAERTLRPEVTYDAVVLLGGAVAPLGSTRDEPAWNDSVERLLAVRELLLAGRAKVAIVSGGALGSSALRTEAEYLARELVALGVPEAQVLVEATANNTRENATASRALLEARGAKSVLLVTSAFHAPRALGCFRAVGLEPDVLPVDFRVRHPERDGHVAPRSEYLAQSARALRELLGRVVYRVLGYTR